MPNKIIAVCYARESLNDPGKAPDIQEQIKRAEQYCEEQGWDLKDIYQDNGYSGGDWKRPAWLQLVKDARFHKFNVVITQHRNRIARDTEQFLWFNRNMKESYVRVFSIVGDEFISLDSVGDTAKGISLAMADELMRKITSEKVKKVYEMKKRKAEKNHIKFVWGRIPKEYDIEKIRKLRSEGLGFRRIAKQIGGCSYQTIRRLLQKPHDENNSISKEELNQNNTLPNNPIV